MSHTELTDKRAKSWRAVVEAYQVCAQRYSAAMGRVELTSSQFEVLLLIRCLGAEATPKTIADQLLVTKGNITGVTSRLLSQDLVTRQSHETDGRSQVFRLTDYGNEKLKSASQIASEFVHQQLEPFTDEEVEMVGRLMRRMKTHLLSLDADSIVKAALDSTTSERS